MMATQLIFQDNGCFHIRCLTMTPVGEEISFQWFLSDTPSWENAKPYVNRTLYGITLTDDIIRNECEGKWLACRMEKDGSVYDETEFIFLTTNPILLMHRNNFNVIDFIDEQGDLDDNHGYVGLIRGVRSHARDFVF